MEVTKILPRARSIALRPEPNKLHNKDRYSAAVTDVMDALKETSSVSPLRIQKLEPEPKPRMRWFLAWDLESGASSSNWTELGCSFGSLEAFP